MYLLVRVITSLVFLNPGSRLCTGDVYAWRTYISDFPGMAGDGEPEIDDIMLAAAAANMDGGFMPPTEVMQNAAGLNLGGILDFPK